MCDRGDGQPAGTHETANVHQEFGHISTWYKYNHTWVYIPIYLVFFVSWFTACILYHRSYYSDLKLKSNTSQGWSSVGHQVHHAEYCNFHVDKHPRSHGVWRRILPTSIKHNNAREIQQEIITVNINYILHTKHFMVNILMYIVRGHKGDAAV